MTGVRTIKAVATLAGDDTDFALTKYEYESAGRMSTVIAPDPDGAGTDYASLKSVQEFDDLGRTTFTKVYKAGSPDTLLAQSENVYTGSRLTSSKVYSVASGTAGDASVTSYGYDTYGRQCKVTGASGGFSKTLFDLAGQVTGSYVWNNRGRYPG